MSRVRFVVPWHLSTWKARRHSREVLNRWQLRELVEPVLLIVSELGTNAVGHGRSDAHGPHRERGRGVGPGLDIVKACSSESWVDLIDDDGKIMWAQVPSDH